MADRSEALATVRAKLHGGSQLTADEIILLESEHGREVASYHKALQDRYEEIVSLRDRIVVLEKGLRAILEGHACDPEFPETHPWARCTICSPQEKRWPCTTVLEARAALGGEG